VSLYVIDHYSCQYKRQDLKQGSYVSLGYLENILRVYFTIFMHMIINSYSMYYYMYRAINICRNIFLQKKF